ncbi:MAG: deoxyribose-phosphate aldolase [Candidatus Paceibacterota bacterium]|jgi:deoxyribose-phosphate aldolase
MKVNKYIDHTNIKKNAQKEDILRTCNEAKEYDFRGVCIRPKWVKLVSKELVGTGIKTVVLLDDPIGDSSHEERLKMSKKAINDGADELDIVINVPDVIHDRWNKIEKDLKSICKLQDTKVIIGSGFLTDNDIAKASQVVKRAGAICVKTATDKDPLENRELKEKGHHLEIMRKNAPGLLIKASGNIKTLKDLKLMIKHGADIVGSSSGVSIMNNK